MITMILDGYNVIGAVPELAQHMDRSLQSAREALVRLCQEYRARRGDIERLYVVFDGNEAYAHWPQGARGGVTALFTRGEDADERILSMVRAEEGRSRFVVVTNDNEVMNNARVHRADVLSADAFYRQVRKTSARRPGPPAVPDKATLSARDAQQITEEYRKHLEERAMSDAPPRSGSARRTDRK